MNFKIITLPLMALALSFTIVSCDSEKNEKDEKNETSETKQDEAGEEVKDKVVTTGTATLPSGETSTKSWSSSSPCGRWRVVLRRVLPLVRRR